MTQCEAWICAQHHDMYSVYLPEAGVFQTAGLTGKMRQQLMKQQIQLVTGDRVTLIGKQITALYARHSLLSRLEAGTRGQVQALAANMDYVFICTSLNEEFNIKRIDRYLAMADGARVEAVLLITKADLEADLSQVNEALMALNPPRQAIFCSALNGMGIKEVENLVAGGKRGVLMGSSGVGKSSLINALKGSESLATSLISEHKARGRHTTTSRALIPLENGGFLIDSPGMRELKLDRSDTEAGFADIRELAQGCRFGDCAHGREPGCAVQEAVANGLLRRERLTSYLKLKTEEQKQGKRRR